MDVKDIKHGTPSAYNWGCSCNLCKACNTQRQRDRRARTRTLRKLINGRWVSPYAEHGTLNGYCNWQCRCAPCTEVHSSACRDRRLRRKLRDATT